MAVADDQLFPLPGNSPLSNGSLVLRRPYPGGLGSRAWDAADEQLVAEALDRIPPGSRVAVVDDTFGALSLGLASLSPWIAADSAALPLALSRNAPLDKLPIPEVNNWQDEVDGPVRERFDAVVMKVPRQLDYLDFLLRWSNQVLRPGGLLLTGGMIKHLPNQSAALYQQRVVTETVLPARKKARLVVCRPGQEGLDDWPGLWKGYRTETVSAPIKALPAVFARDRLDIGTRLLLPLVGPAVAGAGQGSRVLDLACGNGVLGLAALTANRDLAVTFADISSQALASAKANARQLPDGPLAPSFRHSDGLTQEDGCFDLILLNPPFHEGGAVGDHIALRLFAEAALHLAPGGRVLVVGNRHLGYHRSLRSTFGSVVQLTADPKFVVFEASAPVQRGGRS